MDLENARILITGAGRGFGRAMCEHFTKNKSRILALDIDKKALHILKEELPSIEILSPCDIADSDLANKTVQEAVGIWDGIDVLINNAGIMKNALLFNLLSRPDGKHSVSLWEQVISINQTGVFNMTRSCVEQMIKMRNKGVIINMSSIAAKGNMGQTAYAASKAAVEAMTKVWAKELGQFGIRSVAVAPGFIDSAGTAEALEEKMLAQWIEKTPLRRTGTIQEVVQTVQFVIENDFINGEVININGGLNL